MTIDFKNLLLVLPHVTSANHPVLLRGRHGIGKSSVIYQYGESLGMRVVERRASQMTEGDLLGLPKVEGKVTTWLAPEWLHDACNKPVILFLDEVDRATMEVRQGIFELCDSRKIAGYTLHADTLIFACVNGGEHGAQYQVGEMDPAELDRWSVWDIEPTVEDWMAWGKDNVDSLILDFINQNRDHLEHKGDIEPAKRYPSRRSWKRLNDVLVGAELINEASPSMFNLAQSFVGFEAAVALNDFAANYDRIVTVDQLLAGERKEVLAAFTLNEHCAMITKLENEGVCKEDMTDEQVSALGEYFVSMPSEASMKLWQVISMAGNQPLTIKFHATNKGEVGRYLSQILGG